ncbi:MAG TPA: APC family permease [Longimicrobiales bacterium]
MAETSPASAPTLVRALGVPAMSANVMNNIVGVGIFALPGAVAAVLGPAALVAYVVCALAVGLVALCFAELGSRVSASGGIYAYIEAAFGPFAGFLAGVLFWIGAQAVSSAAVAVILVGFLAQLLPPLGAPLPRALVLVALYATLALLNMRGVRVGARAVIIITVAKLTPLALLVVAGVLASAPANLTWHGMPSLGDVGRASLLLIFAFTGTESAVTASGEVRSPSRTMPRAIFLGMLGVLVLYMSVHISAQGVLGAALAHETAAPLLAVAQRVFGPAGATLVLVGGAVSALGWITSDMLGTPRLIHAFASDGLFPRRLAAVHARFRTPAAAIAFHGLICLALALTGSFRMLVVLSVIAVLPIYLACCLAVLRLRRLHVASDGAPFVIPGGPIVPLLACAVVAWLLSGATWAEAGAVAALLTAAAAVYGLRAWRRRRVGTSEVAREAEALAAD